MIQTVFALPVRTDRAPLVDESEDEAEHSQEVVATPSVQTQSSDRLTRQLVRRSSFRTSGSASRGRASGKSPLTSIYDGRRCFRRESTPCLVESWLRRRVSEGALPGPSHPRFVSEGDGSSFAAQSDLISLAGGMRSAGCRLPYPASSVEREA
ncbi:hypothetical protein F2Q68_00019925 [Brassica cretica]|uniref:Uncharacterized protein n=1 Tax=Brassica cretica TaxID=69181 RepID=A0A8S9FPR7_BRACR|nr:hypothetical protein F2Q68_00019925 [Brassica cretica]